MLILILTPCGNKCNVQVLTPDSSVEYISIEIKTAVLLRSNGSKVSFSLEELEGPYNCEVAGEGRELHNAGTEECLAWSCKYFVHLDSSYTLYPGQPLES